MNNKENTNKMVKDECINHIHLIDVANVLYGYPLQAKNFCEDSSYLPVVRIRDIKAGFSTTYYRESVPMEYIVHLGDILVGMDGEFNLSKWRSREAILNQRVCKIESKDESIILNQYLFHLLGPIFKKIEKNIQGSTVKHLSAKIINSIKIPLPPLPIQQEIVRILDTFTNLTAELTAELTARRKQYEYYRDELLTFGEDVSRVQLGLVCDFKYGKGNNIPNETGEYPVYGCNGIVSTTNTFNSEDAPIIGHIGSAGVVNWGKGKHFVTYNGTICRVKADKIRSRYAYYVLNSLHLERFVKGSQPFLSYGDFSKVLIPLPPIERQDEIVRILDQFDYFCNDLTSGIPAEISARQKQYEYYRNQLLTFKQIGG